MHFCLLDRVLELHEDRIVAIKHVSAAEEYLQDHFPSFPVLPGVMMLEAMVQAARRLVQTRSDHHPESPPLVLGEIRTLKYGAFVRPGASLRIEVAFVGQDDEQGRWRFKGSARVVEPNAAASVAPPTAVSGQFCLRPVRVGPSPARA